MLHLPTIDEVNGAVSRIAGIAIKTPMVPYFGKRASGRDVYLKLENLQKGGSFKIRAGANALLSLEKGKVKNGVYTASAGNFGLGVAIAAEKLGINLKVFAPDTAAQKKISALKDLGAEVKLLSFDEWWNILVRHNHSGEEGAFLHPVANQDVLAGNATIGFEIMKAVPDVEAILVPFGGGGLISGISSVVKTINPDVKVFGCESMAATPLKKAFKAQMPISVSMEPSFINGIGSTGVLLDMWPIIRQAVDGALTSTVHEARLIVKELAFKNAIISEGAGAVPIGCLKELDSDYKKVVCVVSGGNIDGKILSEILSE